jgi:hypothetical protein
LVKEGPVRTQEVILKEGKTFHLDKKKTAKKGNRAVVIICTHGVQAKLYASKRTWMYFSRTSLYAVLWIRSGSDSAWISIDFWQLDLDAGEQK